MDTRSLPSMGTVRNARILAECLHSRSLSTCIIFDSGIVEWNDVQRIRLCRQLHCPSRHPS